MISHRRRRALEILLREWLAELGGDEAVQLFWVCRYPLRLFELLPGVVVVWVCSCHYSDSVSTYDRVAARR